MSHSFVTPRTVPLQAPLPWGFPGKNTGMGCHFLLQGIKPMSPALLQQSFTARTCTSHSVLVLALKVHKLLREPGKSTRFRFSAISAMGFPWWLGGNFACHCRRHRFNPWSGKIQMTWSNWIREPQLLNLCSRAWELQLLSQCAAIT